VKSMPMNLSGIGAPDDSAIPRMRVRLSPYSWGRLTPRNVKRVSSAMKATPPAT
jgi:hypothetical protein